MRSYLAVYAVFLASALALGGCKTTNPNPLPPAPPSLCEHPCDTLNGVEPPRMVSCQFASKIADSCRVAR